jgi:hypothetical protein
MNELHHQMLLKIGYEDDLVQVYYNPQLIILQIDLKLKIYELELIV